MWHCGEESWHMLQVWDDTCPRPELRFRQIVGTWGLLNLFAGPSGFANDAQQRRVAGTCARANGCWAYTCELALTTFLNRKHCACLPTRCWHWVKLGHWGVKHRLRNYLWSKTTLSQQWPQRDTLRYFGSTSDKTMLKHGALRKTCLIDKGRRPGRRCLVTSCTVTSLEKHELGEDGEKKTKKQKMKKQTAHWREERTLEEHNEVTSAHKGKIWMILRSWGTDLGTEGHLAAPS